MGFELNEEDYVQNSDPSIFDTENLQDQTSSFSLN